MPVTHAIRPILSFAVPLTSPILALLVTLLLPAVLRRARGNLWRAGAIGAAVALFFGAYHAACLNARFEAWLAALNTPLSTVYLILVLPAIYLPRGRGYKFFLVLPAVMVALAVAAVLDAYRSVPEGEFYWFPIRPAYLMGGIVALLVLLQSFLSLKSFRFAVRLTCLLSLMYGGFAFRQSGADYEAMLQRRRDAQPGIMNVSETTPALQHHKRMLYLPSAPCRFTADGGYVQGCNLEMVQRLMQVDFAAVARKNSTAVGSLAVIMGALVLFLMLCFLTARWCCGWLCPLSTLGSVLDWLRRRLRLPHIKPVKAMKLACLFLGLAVLTVTLAMAKAYPHVDDKEGKYAGIKIPVYPFCKVCPSQQVCSFVGQGPSAYAGLPTWEWGHGFFRVACFSLLGLFLLSFLTARRLWCRLCPMGMISGIFNRGGMFRLTKEPQKCNRCGVCAEVCPMDIDLVRAEMKDTDVSSYDCVLCLKCVEKCPKDGCLSLEHGGVKIVESRYDAKVR